MIAVFVSVCWAGVQLGAPSDEWSVGAMTSWRTTPFRRQWAPDPLQDETLLEYYGHSQASWHSEPAIHAVASLGVMVADVSVGNEFGLEVGRHWVIEYNGFRIALRAGVQALTVDVPDTEIDPLNLSIGGGVAGWLSCCSAGGYGSGRGFGGPSERPFPTVWAADRIWLWEPLGIDVRYEVPLSVRPLPTVSVGVVFAARN